MGKWQLSAKQKKHNEGQLFMNFTSKISNSPTRPVEAVGGVGILELSDARRHKKLIDLLEEAVGQGGVFTCEQLSRFMNFPDDPKRRVRDLRKRGWKVEPVKIEGTTRFNYRIWKTNSNSSRTVE